MIAVVCAAESAVLQAILYSSTPHIIQMNGAISTAKSSSAMCYGICEGKVS